MAPDESAFADIESRDSVKVAALDIGSNSFHLVVARVLANSVQILHRVKQKVRLAEGLDDNNVLSQEAILRGLQTMQVIAESLRGFEPDRVRIVATHTLRKAVNAREFINAAKLILPYPVEVISGTEEARLIYSGVAHTSHSEGRRLVIDIGGGSTEFIIGEGFNAMLCRSLQMGCVSYTKRFFTDGELKKKSFEQAITAAEQELELIDVKYRRLGWEQCIGTSGTIKTLCQLAQEFCGAAPDHGVTLANLKQLMKLCIEAGHIDNLKMEGLSEDRRPVFAAGLAVLIAAFESLKIEALHFSPAALREGVLYQMEDALHHTDIRHRTASSLATRYDVDTEQANRVLATTLELFDQCASDWKLKHPDYRSMLGWAALLHEVGIQINTRGVQRHSGYILQCVDMPGFTQEQQDLLATLVRYHRKKIRVNDIPDFYQYEAKAVKRMLVILRLGILLNIKRQDGFLPDLQIDVSKHKCHLTFPADWLEQRPILHADLIQEITYLSALDIEFSIE